MALLLAVARVVAMGSQAIMATELSVAFLYIYIYLGSLAMLTEIRKATVLRLHARGRESSRRVKLLSIGTDNSCSMQLALAFLVNSMATY
jgi:hypothetical protein